MNFDAAEFFETPNLLERFLENLRGEWGPGMSHYCSRDVALDGLRKITGQDFGYDCDAWDTWIRSHPDEFMQMREKRRKERYGDKTDQEIRKDESKGHFCWLTAETRSYMVYMFTPWSFFREVCCIVKREVRLEIKGGRTIQIVSQSDGKKKLVIYAGWDHLRSLQSVLSGGDVSESILLPDEVVEKLFPAFEGVCEELDRLLPSADEDMHRKAKQALDR